MENVADDLADLTKYVWCLWQLFGFSQEDMLKAVGKKTDLLWQVIGHEFRQPEEGQAVILVDLDNTVARYAEGLDEWMLEYAALTPVKLDTYDMAARYDIPRPTYEGLKAEWEAGGGYAKLKPYDRWVAAIKDLRRSENAFLVVCTARPVAETKRVWYDCYAWAEQHLENVDRMLFLDKGRVDIAKEYRDRGHPVLVFEDNPSYLPTLALMEMPTLVHRQPYNERADNDRVRSWGHLGFTADEPVGLVTAGRRMLREQRS
jgi:hypothetical protein